VQIWEEFYYTYVELTASRVTTPSAQPPRQ
jgi:hypothetical protein